MATSAPGSGQRPEAQQQSLDRLLGLAVFGEKVAARTYLLMSQLRSDYALHLRKFASMEGKHATWFSDAARQNGIRPDREFADRELGYLLDQVESYHRAGDFDALAIVQGFIVECLAIATYEPFLGIAHQYPGTYDVVKQALEDEYYHVDWVTRYLRLRYFDAEDEFMSVAKRVNVQGVDCIGGSLMNIADYLTEAGMSGATCAGAMIDGYTNLLERVGVDSRTASKNVVSLFMPLIRKYRHRERIK